MVPAIAAALVALTALASSALAGVHLTPTLGDYDLDGAKLTHLVFRGGKGEQITYSPPVGWSYFGDEGKLTLRPPKTSQAEASVVVVPLEQASVFDEASQAQLRATALALAPAGSENITFISAEKDLVQIGSKETVLVTFSYTFYGQRYGRSVMFLNRGEEQVRFQLVSRLADFADLQRTFLQSHFTWQNL